MKHSVILMYLKGDVEKKYYLLHYSLADLGVKTKTEPENVVYHSPLGI